MASVLTVPHDVLLTILSHANNEDDIRFPSPTAQRSSTFAPNAHQPRFLPRDILALSATCEKLYWEFMNERFQTLEIGSSSRHDVEMLSQLIEDTPRAGLKRSFVKDVQISKWYRPEVEPLLLAFLALVGPTLCALAYHPTSCMSPALSTELIRLSNLKTLTISSSALCSVRQLVLASSSLPSSSAGTAIEQQRPHQALERLYLSDPPRSSFPDIFTFALPDSCASTNSPTTTPLPPLSPAHLREQHLLILLHSFLLLHSPSLIHLHLSIPPKEFPISSCLSPRPRPCNRLLMLPLEENGWPKLQTLVMPLCGVDPLGEEDGRGAGWLKRVWRSAKELQSFVGGVDSDLLARSRGREERAGLIVGGVDQGSLVRESAEDERKVQRRPRGLASFAWEEKGFGGQSRAMDVLTSLAIPGRSSKEKGETVTDIEEVEDACGREEEELKELTIVGKVLRLAEVQEVVCRLGELTKLELEVADDVLESELIDTFSRLPCLNSLHLTRSIPFLSAVPSARRTPTLLSTSSSPTSSLFPNMSSPLSPIPLPLPYLSLQAHSLLLKCPRFTSLTWGNPNSLVGSIRVGSRISGKESYASGDLKMVGKVLRCERGKDVGGFEEAGGWVHL